MVRVAEAGATPTVAGNARFSGAAGGAAISSVAGGGRATSDLTSDLEASAGGDAAMEVACAGADPSVLFQYQTMVPSTSESG
jgi:hypothetical protein